MPTNRRFLAPHPSLQYKESTPLTSFVPTSRAVGNCHQIRLTILAWQPNFSNTVFKIAQESSNRSMPQALRSPRGLLHTFPSSPSLTHSSCSSEDTLLFKFTEEKGNSLSFPAFSWEVGKILDPSHTAPCGRSFPYITLSNKHSQLYASQTHLVCWSEVLRLQPQHQGAHIPPPPGKSTKLPEQTFSLNEHFSGIKN